MGTTQSSTQVVEPQLLPDDVVQSALAVAFNHIQVEHTALSRATQLSQWPPPVLATALASKHGPDKALFLAAASGRAEVVQWLVPADPHPTVSILVTAMTVATKRRHGCVFDALLPALDSSLCTAGYDDETADAPHMASTAAATYLATARHMPCGDVDITGLAPMSAQQAAVEFCTTVLYHTARCGTLQQCLTLLDACPQLDLVPVAAQAAKDGCWPACQVLLQALIADPALSSDTEHRKGYMQDFGGILGDILVSAAQHNQGEVSQLVSQLQSELPRASIEQSRQHAMAAARDNGYVALVRQLGYDPTYPFGETAAYAREAVLMIPLFPVTEHHSVRWSEVLSLGISVLYCTAVLAAVNRAKPTKGLQSLVQCCRILALTGAVFWSSLFVTTSTAHPRLLWLSNRLAPSGQRRLWKWLQGFQAVSKVLTTLGFVLWYVRPVVRCVRLLTVH